MIRNYLKIAFRNLLRYKGFSFINIFSLAIGVAGCMLIGLFVWDEKQFDRFVPGGENIYRLYNENKDENATTYAAAVAPMYTTFLKQQYPEVEVASRMMMIGDKYLVERGNTSGYEEKGRFVDPDFFEIFPLRFISGDPKTALTAPGSVVLTEGLAQQYFGKEDALEKTIKIDSDTLVVKGVLAAIPEHFHLDIRYLRPISAVNFPQERLEKWTWTQFYGYIKLRPGTDAAQLQRKFQEHVRKDIHPTLTAGGTFLPFLQPLKDIHLRSSDFIYDNAIRGNESYVKGLSIIAIFVLVIACFNFINLATARSFRRAKEIGVRKVIGADRKQLIFQFIGETIFLSVIAVIIAVTATALVLPYLNAFTGKSISFNPVSNPVLGLSIAGAAVLIGVLAGIYPALVLSGFQPVKVFKNMRPSPGTGNAGWLRPALVVVQFALSALLIVSSIIVYRQIRFLNEKDLGFNKDQLIYFQARGEVGAKLQAFKAELQRNPNIIAVTSGYGLPGDQFAGETVNVPGTAGEKKYSTKLFIGDHDYVSTLGLRLVAGRDFSREMATDVEEAFIINETAVREFGFGSPEQAIGKKIEWEKWIADSLNPVKKGQVIGVVQDFHYKSLHEKITSSVIQIYPPVLFKLAVRLRSADIGQTLSYINTTWNNFSPQYPLDYKFVDETYEGMYQSETKLSTLLLVFTIMAIVIGCLGLFALAAFSSEQRVKEIGIRKVLGASVFNIVGLLSKNFLLLVLLASLLAFPIAWWAMNSWLEDFQYRIAISWWVFGIAAIVALAIAFITISFQTVKAATANPVRNLRSE